VSGAYLIRPKADLDDQSYYLATEASSAVGHRFLLAAHETFGLLASRKSEDGMACPAQTS